MTLNDRQALPSEHKEREEQTNDDNNPDSCVHHLVRPHVVGCVIKVPALEPSAPISTPIVAKKVNSASGFANSTLLEKQAGHL